MLPLTNSYSVLYIVFAWFLGMCYGFVLLSSAAGQSGDINLFEPGETLTYRWHSTVLLNEKDDSSKNVGFFVDGDVIVQTVWGSTQERILKVQLKSPQLHIRSRKAPSPDGFVPHSSKLDSFPNKSFLIFWSKGKIDKILLPKNEPTSLHNIKKGIASLLQFQLLDGQSQETDASGQCLVTYESTASNKIRKSKFSCESPDFLYLRNPDKILGTTTQSSRYIDYEFDLANNLVKTIESKESHVIHLTAKEDVGNFVETSQTLTYSKTEDTEPLPGDDIENVLDHISKADDVVYVQDTLLTEKEENVDARKSFTSAVHENRDNLKTSLLGGLQGAKAIIELVSIARKANKEDIAKALESKKNKDILPQLYDILGYSETFESHEAVMKKLHFDKETHKDLSERYLWALSVCSHPNPDIITDLLKRYQKSDNFPQKVKETLILTIASMSYRLSNIPEKRHVANKISSTVEETLINGLDYAKGDERFQYIRALKNLQSDSSIPTLLKIIKTGTQKEGVLAWKAIKSFNPKLWNEDVLKSAQKSFFQIDKKYDSSSRTLAADILLQSNPSDETLSHLLYHLVSNDTAYEIKQYVYQTIKMLADEDESFKGRVLAIIRSDKRLNNYSALSPRGLSTALSRYFLKSPSSNGSLFSVQEMNSGVVKRGIVNVLMHVEDESKELFGLGIFAGGLSSFISSDNDDNDGEDEAATAGMELTLLGTQLRPFVFFRGQGELMGHVWAGTASEKTPAFQALVMLQDHLEFLRLGPGFVAELDVKGATSFDLSGKMEVSLWNRNAESLVEKSAGIMLTGLIKIDTSFVRSQVEFRASVEPKLKLQSDIDFSSNMNMCMRLTQPDTLFRHNIFKIERIPGSKHKLRIAKYKKQIIPGTTYSLNKKNNEMCSAIFT